MGPYTPQTLLEHPENPLAKHYSHFKVEERLLLTGHSHQAWPDVALLGQQEAFHIAAAHLDEKWSDVHQKIQRVRMGFSRLLGCEPSIALFPSTHTALVTLLSALPIQKRRRIVTTDEEFHAARRQFQRLQEEGFEILRIPAQPAATVGSRLARHIDDKTLLAFVSTVFFTDASIARELEACAERCHHHGAALVLDTYHHLNALPFDWNLNALDPVYVVGGGYKYCQLGEGNAFLRYPPHSTLRPVITGWFAEFETLSDTSEHLAKVPYPTGPAQFAGSTFDPTPHYRAARVFDFFDDMKLTPAVLRSINQAQQNMIVSGLQENLCTYRGQLAFQLPEQDLNERGAFIPLRSNQADRLQKMLLEHGLLCDARGTMLRIGPAPYLGKRQIENTIEKLLYIAKAEP